MVVFGAGKGSGGCLDAGTVLCFGGTGGPFVCFIDVGYIPAYWKDTRRILPLGVLQVDWASAKEKDGLDVVLPSQWRRRWQICTYRK